MDTLPLGVPTDQVPDTAGQWIPKGSDAFHSWVATDQGSDTVGHRVSTDAVNVVQVLRVLESQRPVKFHIAGSYSRVLIST